MRLSIKTINAEMARRGFVALLAKGDGYFYFRDGDTDAWLDRTVRVPTLQSLSLDEWIEEFNKLREKNHQLMRSVGKGTAKPALPKSRFNSKRPQR